MYSEDKIKVLYLTNTLEFGGAERRIVECCTKLDSAIFEPMVGCFEKKGVMADAVESLGIRIVELGYRKVKISEGIRAGGLITVWKTAAAIRHLVRDEAICIVHSFLPNTNIVASVAKLLSPRMKLITSKVSLADYKKNRPFLRFVERVIAKIPDLVCCNAIAVRDDMLKYETPPEKKIRLIYNGVDVETIHGEALRIAAPEIRNELNIPENATVIGTVGNLTGYKGHADLIDAARMVIDRLPEIHFVFIGKDKGVKDDLVRQSSRLGINEKVHFPGSRPDVARMLGLFDVFAFPSHQEGCPNALIEAMAAECPIVATSVGGNSELIVDNETGFLVPPHSPHQLAEKLITLLERKDTALHMAHEAYRRAGREFNLERMVGEMANLYLELTGKKNDA